MSLSRDDPASWGDCGLQIIAHDTATTRDRSTAVVGRMSDFRPPEYGLVHLERLPQGLYGAARASALAEVDRKFGGRNLIVADLSNDPSYLDALAQAFGRRVIGVHIGAAGDGTTFERLQPLRGVVIPKYSLGRTYVIDKLHATLENGALRLPADNGAKEAFAELAALETVISQVGNRLYNCLPGSHDDLGMSMAIASWALRHPHAGEWVKLVRPPAVYAGARASSSGWT
jgi:hypothetical protein